MKPYSKNKLYATGFLPSCGCYSMYLNYGLRFAQWGNFRLPCLKFVRMIRKCWQIYTITHPEDSEPCCNAHFSQYFTHKTDHWIGFPGQWLFHYRSMAIFCWYLIHWFRWPVWPIILFGQWYSFGFGGSTHCTKCSWLSISATRWQWCCPYQSHKCH